MFLKGIFNNICLHYHIMYMYACMCICIYVYHIDLRWYNDTFRIKQDTYTLRHTGERNNQYINIDKLFTRITNIGKLFTGIMRHFSYPSFVSFFSCLSFEANHLSLHILVHCHSKLFSYTISVLYLVLQLY